MTEGMSQSMHVNSISCCPSCDMHGTPDDPHATLIAWGLAVSETEHGSASFALTWSQLVSAEAWQAPWWRAVRQGPGRRGAAPAGSAEPLSSQGCPPSAHQLWRALLPCSRLCNQTQVSDDTAMLSGLPTTCSAATLLSGMPTCESADTLLSEADRLPRTQVSGGADPLRII